MCVCVGGGGGVVFYVTFLFSEKRIAGVEDSCCLTSRETIRLFSDREKGGGGGGGGEGDYIPVATLSPPE